MSFTNEELELILDALHYYCTVQRSFDNYECYRNEYNEIQRIKNIVASKRERMRELIKKIEEAVG